MSSDPSGMRDGFVELAHALGSADSGSLHSAASPAHDHPPGVSSSAPHDKPRIEVHRSGDVIESIEFICSCGERLDVQIGYDGD